MAAVLDTDRAHLGELIPVGIQDILKQSYRSTPHTKLLMTPDKFVEGLLKTLYHDGNYNDDFALTPLEEGEEPSSHLNSGLFNMFLSYETHLDLVDRRNCEYAGKYFKGEDDKLLTPEQYAYARNRVLDALVRKAIDCFSEWKGIEPPESSTDNERLFFTSLKDYIILGRPIRNVIHNNL